MFTEPGPVRLNRDLEKYIWADKPHLRLADLWEFHNRYVYLPRLKDKQVLIKSVLGAISQAISGPFAYAEGFDETNGKYEGLVIEPGGNTPVVIDSDSVIVRSNIAEENRPEPAGTGKSDDGDASTTEGQPQPGDGEPPKSGDGSTGERLPTRFQGTVIISSERPARDMHQVVEAVIEQLTTIPGATVELKLEIDAEVPGGIDKGKSRTLLENASTLGFIDKVLD